MNGFFIDKHLTERERMICLEIKNEGPLGLNIKKVKRRGITNNDLNSLQEDGIIRKTTLFKLSQELIGSETARETYEDLEEGGGFLALTDKRERDFFRCFEIATTVVAEGETLKNQVIRYQVIPILYNYMDLIYQCV